VGKSHAEGVAPGLQARAGRGTTASADHLAEAAGAVQRAHDGEASLPRGGNGQSYALEAQGRGLLETVLDWLRSAWLWHSPRRSADSDRGNVVDLKKALEAAHGVGRRDLTQGEVSLSNGTVFRNVQIDNDQDARQFETVVAKANLSAPVAEPSPLPATSASKPVPRKEGLLSHQIGVHLGDLERANREKKTVLDSRHTLRLLLGIVGDKPVSALNGDDCRLFFDEVSFWPRNASKQAGNAGRSVREIIAKAKVAGGEPPASHTLSKHRQRLPVFLNFLLNNDLLKKNPLKGIAKASKFDAEDDTGRAFTQSELNAIFEPVAFAEWSAKYPHRFWASLIGLFSGARITEVCQLYTDDVATEHGVPGFHVRKSKPGQKLKNKFPLRFIPIAQLLLDAVFLTFVEDMKVAGQERLFRHLPNADGNGFGRQMSRQFSVKALSKFEAGVAVPAYRSGQFSLPAWASNKNKGTA